MFFLYVFKIIGLGKKVLFSLCELVFYLFIYSFHVQITAVPTLSAAVLSCYGLLCLHFCSPPPQGSSTQAKHAGLLAVFCSSWQWLWMPVWNCSWGAETSWAVCFGFACITFPAPSPTAFSSSTPFSPFYITWQDQHLSSLMLICSPPFKFNIH